MRKRTMIIAGVAIVALGGGVAYAAWSSSGAGTGQVSAKGSVDSSITAGGGAGLFPGATDVTYTVSINNPNDYPVKVTGISAGSSKPQGQCAAGTVTSDAVSNPAGTIAPGQSVVYTLKAKMAADADNSCQNLTFDLPLTAQLVSAAS